MNTIISGDTVPFTVTLKYELDGKTSTYAMAAEDTVQGRFVTKDGDTEITNAFDCARNDDGSASITIPSIESDKLSDYDKTEVILCIEVTKADDTVKEFQYLWKVKKGYIP